MFLQLLSKVELSFKISRKILSFVRFKIFPPKSVLKLEYAKIKLQLKVTILLCFLTMLAYSLIKN